MTWIQHVVIGDDRPSGHAGALEVLVELYRETGAERYAADRIEESFRYFGEALRQNPAGLTQFLTALKKRLQHGS